MKWFCCQVSHISTDKPNNSPSEFADMWKELKLKENSPYGSSTDSQPNLGPEHRKDDREKETRESNSVIKVK